MSVDLLVRDAYIYVDREWEIESGWIAIKDGRIQALGKSGDEPVSARVISANGRLVTPGLIWSAP